MDLVLLAMGSFEIALDACTVARFDLEGGQRRAHTELGVAIGFDRARMTTAEPAALVHLPALVSGLRALIGAQAIWLGDERPIVLVAPDSEQAARLCALGARVSTEISNARVST